MAVGRAPQHFSKIKEAVAAWGSVQQLLRSGDEGSIVPVVIPKHKRGYSQLYLAGFTAYLLIAGILLILFGGLPGAGLGGLAIVFGLILGLVTGVSWFNSARISIEQGTTGVMSEWGKITRTLSPGLHYLWGPWQKVEFIVDTATEIPYTAPVLSVPTHENVPLKTIEFFLKFRIVDPLAFVRSLGATNFDAVLSSMVQDAIRQRTRIIQTERAYDLRGADVGDMQEILNRQMQPYGVRLIGANIPEVQLPDQYQQHLATKERVAKELAAYEREWELTRRQRTDTLLMEIERAKKVRDARLVEVRTSINEARESVAQVLQQKETEAQKVRWEIETQGRAMLKAAENEDKALRRLGKAYRDNWAVLQYELARRRLGVAEKLVNNAPRPVLVETDGSTDQSALSTLVAAQLLPKLMNGNGGSLKQIMADGDTDKMLQQLLQGQQSGRKQ